MKMNCIATVLIFVSSFAQASVAEPSTKLPTTQAAGSAVVRGVPLASVPVERQFVVRQIARTPRAGGDTVIIIEWPASISIKPSEAGYRVVWKRGVASLVDLQSPAAANPATKKMLMELAWKQAGPAVSALDGTAFDMKFDSHWQYEGLADDASAKAAALRTIEAMNRMRADHGAKPVDADTATLMTSRNVLENVLPLEALLYFQAERMILLRETGDDASMLVASPVGSGQIPMRVKTELARGTDAASRLVLNVNSTMKMTDVLHAIESIPGTAAVSEKDKRDAESVELTGGAEFHIESPSGLITYAKSSAPTAPNQKQTTYEWTAR